MRLVAAGVSSLCANEATSAFLQKPRLVLPPIKTQYFRLDDSLRGNIIYLKRVLKFFGYGSGIYQRGSTACFANILRAYELHALGGLSSRLSRFAGQVRMKTALQPIVNQKP